MFAVRIRHPVTDAALAEERAAFAEAIRGWCRWLEMRPGFVAVAVLEEGGGEISAMSLWRDEEAFTAALGNPEAVRHASPLGAFFVAPSSPEAVPVLYFGGAGP